MKKTTQKAIKNFVRDGLAVDVTNYSFGQSNELREHHSLEKIRYSLGVYGLNGGLLKDENGNLYAITARTSALFQLF